jgi:chromosome segregation ATPase
MHHVGKQAARKAWGQILRMAAFGVMSGALVAMVGCEKMENAGRGGDRKVDSAVAESIGNPDASKGAAVVKAALGDASFAGKARGSSELARDEFNQAIALMPEINHQAQLAEGALFDLGQATAAINNIQAISAGASKQDPKDTLAKMDEARGELQKSLDKAKADVATLKAEIDKRQKEIDDLKTQRQKADAEAESLVEKSNNAKGEESVKLFKQSTEARTQAGTFAAQMEMKTAAMMPVQRQMAIAEAQQKLWDNAGKDAPGVMQMIDDRKAQLDAGWAATQQNAQAVSALAKKVASDVVTPGGAADHPNAGARLASALKEGDKARTDARKLLESAAQHADDALKAAKSLVAALKTRADELSAKSPTSADLASIKALMAGFDETQYTLQKGNINIALGNVLADEAVLDAHVKQTLDALSAAMQASGQPAAGFSPPNPDTAKASAEKAYKDAEQALESVVNAKGNVEGIQAMKNAGLSSLLMARFGHYQLTLDDLTRAQLRDDISRAKESSVPVPNSLRGI